MNQSFGGTSCFPLLHLECHRTADILILTAAAWRLPVENTRSFANYVVSSEREQGIIIFECCHPVVFILRPLIS